MPELPEVETMRRGLLGAVGSRITSVGHPRCRLKPIVIKPRLATFCRRAVGQSVLAIDRVGKRIVLRLDCNDVIVFEPRMTGLVLVRDPPDAEHLRFCVELSRDDIPRICFWDRRGLGSVRLLSPAQWTAQLGPEYFGPDALATSPEMLREQLCRSRRPIKTALLDQRRLAGIGNLYASEILHVAGVDPRQRCDRLAPGQWTAVHDAMIGVLNEAIQHEGSTLSDGTYRNVLNQAGRYQNYHRVYDREGELCATCGQASIVRIVQAQRSTFFCPFCQTNRRLHRRSGKLQ